MPPISLERNAEVAPLSAELRVNQGEALLASGQLEAALAIADAVLAEMPELASAHLLRGNACKRLNRFAGAAEEFSFILGLFPEFSQMRVNLAHIYAELLDFQKAEAHLRDAIARSPEFVPAHASLGSLYIRQDRYDLAEAPTRQALTLDTSCIIAHQNLAAILALRNDPEAKTHRDAAYTRQQIFVEHSPSATRTALILTGSGSGNVPYQYLLSRACYNHILWYLEYAKPGQEMHLPHYDFVFNAVGDPDAAAEAQIAAERFAAGCSAPLINRPDGVARTLRSSIPDLIGSIRGVNVPNTLRFTLETGREAESLVVICGLNFPVILRRAGRHGGDGVRLVASLEELSAHAPRNVPLYATEYVEYRSPDGWYRKYRMIFVNRKPYPYHLAIGERWLLHYKTADMRADAKRRTEEEVFLRDPQAALGHRTMAVLDIIAERLDLDYAGIDFSLLPDGQLLLFETNPTMLVHPEDDILLEYKNDAVKAIINAVNMMIMRRLPEIRRE